MVVLVAGQADARQGDGDRALLQQLLPALLEELPPSRAVKLAAKLSGVPRREVYELALSMGAPGVQ
jgi:16S rRNA C1402 (ribose-2'-O) methylase RsmI